VSLTTFLNAFLSLMFSKFFFSDLFGNYVQLRIFFNLRCIVSEKTKHFISKSSAEKTKSLAIRCLIWPCRVLNY